MSEERLRKGGVSIVNTAIRQKIAKSFAMKNCRVFIGRDATEKSFKNLAPRYSVVHLATHGVIDNRHPLYSHLLLTKTEGDPENDGRLEARRIMDLNLNADLAVLSACETANGKVAPGEGVIGMSWAFFVAGTRSIVVSQWKINSASTSELMAAFYANLHSDREETDRNKPQAIRRASLRLLKNDRYRQPFNWAGFVLIGNGMWRFLTKVVSATMCERYHTSHPYPNSGLRCNLRSKILIVASAMASTSS